MKTVVTREHLQELSGIGAYDEDYGYVERVTFHYWPGSGKQGHIPYSCCMCRPRLMGMDVDGTEQWQHRDLMA